MSDPLREIEARWKRCTAGPWYPVRMDEAGLDFQVHTQEGVPICVALRAVNAYAISKAREDIQWLVAEVRRLRQPSEGTKATRDKRSLGKTRDEDITLANVKLEDLTASEEESEGG